MVLAPQHKIQSTFFLSTVEPRCERGSWRLVCVSSDCEQDRDFPKGHCHKLCLFLLLVRTVTLGAPMGLGRSRYCPPKRSYLTPRMGSIPELKAKSLTQFFCLGAQGDLLGTEAAAGEGEKVGGGSSTSQNEELRVKGLPVDLTDFWVLTVRVRCCSRDKEALS